LKPKRLIAALRPDGEELLPLVRAEMDPKRYGSFAPITAGPLVAVLGLTAVGLLGMLSTPVRLARRLLRRE
jgi:hypothetical protein